MNYLLTVLQKQRKTLNDALSKYSGDDIRSPAEVQRRPEELELAFKNFVACFVSIESEINKVPVLFRRLWIQYRNGSDMVFATAKEQEREIKKVLKYLQGILGVYPFALERLSSMRHRSATCVALIAQIYIAKERLYSNFTALVLQVSQKRFPTDISNLLHQSFETNPYPEPAELSRLMFISGLSEKQIVMWFTNRRCRSKRKLQSGSRKDTEETTKATFISPPGSPASNSLTSTVRDKAFEADNFFEEIRQRADMEFYQTMMGDRHQSWIEASQLFADIARW